MKQSDILELIAHFDSSSLSRMEYSNSGAKLILEKAHQAPCPAAIDATENAASLQAQTPSCSNQEASKAQEIAEKTSCSEIKAPLVGIFYSAADPNSEPFVKLGQKVQKGQILCLIEAMKMMNELICPFDGTITKILAKNEDVVEFGKVLFEVMPC